MQVNYIVLGLVLIAIIVVLYFINKRNRKDEKELERELNQTEVTPEELNRDELENE